jgi:predicted MFS family arabinose efflux permease
VVVPAALAAAMAWAPSAGLLIGGLFVFGFVFAVNSALHSYLIVAYSDADKVALNVGFYYMANAIGRLGGTLLSGLVYQAAGLGATLWVSAAMVAVAVLFTLPLATGEGSPPFEGFHNHVTAIDASAHLADDGPVRTGQGRRHDFGRHTHS